MFTYLLRKSTKGRIANNPVWLPCVFHHLTNSCIAHLKGAINDMHFVVVVVLFVATGWSEGALLLLVLFLLMNSHIRRMIVVSEGLP